MKDVDLRGIVLERFYEIRNQEPSMVDPLRVPGLDAIESDHIRLLNICEQLAEHGLLHWRSLRGLTMDGGMGKISASGVDVVEGTARAPIAIALHTISVSQSSNVQIGDSNTQDVNVHIETGDLTRLVTDLTKHLDELNLDARQKLRAEAQIAALKAELAGEDPDPVIVRQAGRTLRSITEGALGSLLATAAAQPTVWQWIHHMLASF